MARGPLIRARRRSGGDPIDKRAVLARLEIFAGLPPAEIDKLANYARVERFRKGATLFHKGDTGVGLVAVHRGQVKISVPSADGKEARLNTMRAGEFLGEIALLDGKPRTADAIAETDCDVVILDRREFQPLLRSSADLCLRIMQVLCARVRRTSEQVEDLTFLHLEGRLAKTLLRLAREQGEGGRLANPVLLTQRDLGQMIGMSRESTNKQLQDWQRRNWVRLVKGGVEIVDHEALEDMIEDSGFEPDEGEG